MKDIPTSAVDEHCRCNVSTLRYEAQTVRDRGCRTAPERPYARFNAVIAAALQASGVSVSKIALEHFEREPAASRLQVRVKRIMTISTMHSNGGASRRHTALHRVWYATARKIAFVWRSNYPPLCGIHSIPIKNNSSYPCLRHWTEVHRRHSRAPRRSRITPKCPSRYVQEQGVLRVGLLL